MSKKRHKTREADHFSRFEVLSADWTEHQEELTRHNAWKLHMELHMIQKKTETCTIGTSSNVLSNWRISTCTYVETDDAAEEQDVHCRQWRFSAEDGTTFSSFARAKNHQDNKKLLGHENWVNMLARSATKWNQAHGKRVARLISYIATQLASVTSRHIRNQRQRSVLRNSTTNNRPNSLDVQEAHKRVSHNNAESEITSLDASSTMEGTPELQLWGLWFRNLFAFRWWCNPFAPKWQASFVVSFNWSHVFLTRLTPFHAESSFLAKLYIFEDNEALHCKETSSIKLEYISDYHHTHISWCLMENPWEDRSLTSSSLMRGHK